MCNVRALQSLRAVLLLTFAVVPVQAQSAVARFKLDVDVGIARTFSKASSDVPGALAFGAVASASLRSHLDHGAVVAVGWQTQRAFDNVEDCLVSSSFPCTPSYPTLTTISGLVGWEARRMNGSTRALLGPAVIHAYESQNSWGVAGRLDVSKFYSRVGLNLWSQGAVAPLLESGRLLQLSAGVGVRFQK